MNKLLLFCCMCLPMYRMQLTSGYGYRIHPITGRYAFHSGMDLRANTDTVFAVLTGEVTGISYDSFLGLNIRMSHGDFETSFGHLSQVFVFRGDSVMAGTPIGITGVTGRVTGEHLHFSVRYKKQPINPVLFLLAISKAHS